jgi:hypothetical protein
VDWQDEKTAPRSWRVAGLSSPSLGCHGQLQGWAFGSNRLAGPSLVQGHAGRVVSKCDAILFERRLDPPIGLGTDFKLLARRRLNLAAEYLDPRIDAVKLGFERLIDDLGKLGVFEHLDPDPQVIDQIADRTDGVPLFVEELTKSVLESGLLHEEADRYVLDRTLPPPAIPTTLQDSLMARLDRLASVRLMAQIGAAIGREFSYALLRMVSRLSQAELRAALARLVASELVFQRATPPDAVYSFKHVLVQDAAHASLLRSNGSSDRVCVHRRWARDAYGAVAAFAAFGLFGVP